MKKAKTKKRKKQKTLAQREKALAKAIEDAFDGISDLARFKHLADDLMGQALAMLSIAEDKPEDVEPVIMWTDDPIAPLFATVSAYAEYTKTPIEHLVDQMIMRIGSSVEAEYRWN
jgi:hypothetical protein